MVPSNSLRISPARQGASFAVKVVPRASREELAGLQQGALRIRLTAPPVEGAANEALVTFVAKLLGVSKRDIDILSGHGSRRKVVAVRSLTPKEVAARLEAYLSQG
jgi:uncharacterized protein (TIGR00251 family)